MAEAVWLHALFLAQQRLLEQALMVIQELGRERRRKVMHLPTTLREKQMRAERHALKAAKGNVSQAARVLGIRRETLSRHLRRGWL